MAYMSEEGYKKLMAELKELETVERPKISAAIAEARDKGDLSENAEYDAAKDRDNYKQYYEYFQEQAREQKGNK